MLNEKLLKVIKEMDDSEIITLWNEYVYKNDLYDDEVLSWDALNDLMQCGSPKDDPFYWVNRFFYGSDDYSTEGGANPNREYFIFNGYGNIESFDYIYNSYSEEFNHIDINALIDYIAENNDSLGNDEIQEVLDEAEEEPEEVTA